MRRTVDGADHHAVWSLNTSNIVSIRMLQRGSQMELRHVSAFVAVAEELHFGRAAERLHIAQPPLSQRIRQLEDELDVQLFERSTRSVSLTAAGEAFLAPARKILADADDARRAARAAGRGEYGRVRLGFAGASSRTALPMMTQAVRARYPRLELVLEGNTYANQAADRLRTGELDLGFIRLPTNTDELDYLVVGSEQLVCAIPATHPLAERQSVSLTDLADEPLVTFPPNSRSSLHAISVQACAQTGFEPRFVQAAPDSYTILALVAAGVGLSLTLSSCTHIQQPGLVYRPLADHSVNYSPAIAWNVSNESPAVQTVIQVAKTVFTDASRLLALVS